jgi:hypothetical protein
VREGQRGRASLIAAAGHGTAFEAFHKQNHQTMTTNYVRRLSVAQRRAYRADVEQALTARGSPSRGRTRSTADPKVREAIARTARLLTYESHATPAHRWFTSRLREIRSREWKGPRARLRYPRHSPRSMLMRVLEHYAMVHAQPWRFLTANDEHEALGRAFLLAAKGRHSNHRTWYRAAGKCIAQELGAFAILFVRNNLVPLLDAENNTNTETQHGPSQPHATRRP